MRMRGLLYREGGIAKRVERAVVIDDDGNAVMLVKETTGVVVENEDRWAVRVQTAVSGVVLGNVLNQAQQGESSRPAIEAARPTPTIITQPDRDMECSCCCCIKWTLIIIFSILCLPFLPLILLCYCCCCRDDD